jgi:DNA mismatch repair protein MutS2
MAPVRSASQSLNIIGRTVDEAIPEVDRFLNDAVMAGLSPVQIIHGKGTGALRRGIQEYLGTLPFVKEYHTADARNGGAGVTEVFF